MDENKMVVVPLDNLSREEEQVIFPTIGQGEKIFPITALPVVAASLR